MDQPAAPRRFRAAFAVATLAASISAHAGIGRTPGFAAVTPLGEARYSIPLAFPPGTNGMTPALSLEYNHRLRGGLLGIGWSLGGLSQITRCARTIAQDGDLGPVAFNANDRLCLDGQRLAVVNGWYFAPNAEYRTEIESFARIRAVQGNSTNGPAWFTVETADGLVHEYGATHDSRIDRAAGAATHAARAWALNRSRDRAGNVIDYRYTEDTDSGAFRIAGIQYNANPANGVAASHEITFNYEDRPNREVDAGYVAGMPLRQVVRLRRIDLRHSGALLRRYELAYEPALSSGQRSRLASVRECGAGGSDCLAPTAFEWQDGLPGFREAAAVPAPVPEGYLVPSRWGWTYEDINGDGMADLVWAGGTSVATSTVRYRFGRGNGEFGPVVNSGIPADRGLGHPTDANGDGRTDFLMRPASGKFAIAHGSPSGLLPPVDTGIPIPVYLRDVRGADINGDGLGDVVWSETLGMPADDIHVRVSYALPAGGHAAPVTLYSQRAALGYAEAQGGTFIGKDIDLDGDGASDLLLDETYTIARISRNGYATDRFETQFQGLLPLDFNDDDCIDYAYKHGATGRLRVRLGTCATVGTTSEIELPDSTGHPYLQAHDWDADGRDDILLRGTQNWLVALSRGDSIAPLLDTGIPQALGTGSGIDIDGDGLEDFTLRNGNLASSLLRNGPAPDLLLSATDGFGVRVEFAYRPLTDPSVHAPGTTAGWPEPDVQSSDSVVSVLRTSDGSGTGSLSAAGFRYEGLRRSAVGRGVLGFRRLVRTELAVPDPLSTETLQRLDWPFAGLPERITLKRESGPPISSTEFQWSKLAWGTGGGARQFPYPSAVTTRRYESGGALDGAEVARSVRTVAAIDAVSGLVTDETATTTEVGGGLNAGSSASLRTLHAGVFNDVANWCLGRAQAVELTASHTLPGGAAIVRSADQEWDGARCRPTRIRLQPGDAQWQVTNDLAYDAFGNLIAEKVRGAGMTVRTTGIEWDARGRLPVRVKDPLGKAVRYAWDAGRGTPKTFTDPNGAITRWEYDAFGRLQREVQADGTSTDWLRAGCKAPCNGRLRYVLSQVDRDTAGAARVTSLLDVDQHERGYRLRAQQPAGGYAVTGVDFDRRGLVRRSDLPHWEGDLGPPAWSYQYDALGRLRGGSLKSPGGPPEGSFALDFDGHSITSTDPLGRRTTLTRSAWGALARSEDPRGGATGYEHDAFGALLRVRDALGNEAASVTYNARGMKTSVTDMDRGTWTWTRNALGETTALRDARNVIVRFEHDSLGRLTRRTAPDGDSTWTWGTSAAKHDIGRLTAASSPGYSESFTYDGIGRPATHKVVADTTYQFGFSYNPLGLLDVLAFPAAGTGGALRVRHDYDAGRVTGLRNAVAPGEPWWTLNAQDAAGHALDESLGMGLRVVTGYSPVTGDPEYRQARAASGATVQDLDWDWDAAGNLARRRDLALGLTEEFGYDALDRLVESRRNSAVDLSVDYDAIGNIRRKSDVCPGTAACYGYHGKRRHAVVAAGGRSYAYDANGNMTSRDGAAIAWSSAGFPVSIAHANGNSSEFSYGPAGNRWKQVARYGSATETTLYVGGALEKVIAGGTTTWHHYLDAPGGIAVQVRRSDGSPAAMRYVTLDHLGSTHRVTDADGAVIAAASFGPFGERRRVDGSGVPTAAELAALASVTRSGFTGHEQLDNVGLVHMNGRVYDPLLGRFISADPYVSMPHDGQGLNRYGYVLNNPLAFTDPSGFDAVPCLANQAGHCVRITVIAVSWAQYMRAMGGAHSAEIASALERDPCGQNGSPLACSMASGQLLPPSSIVLTVGRGADPSLSAGGRFDAVRGFAARVGNLTIASSPVALLFGADPDFQYFREPDNAAGRGGAAAGNVGYLAGGFAGMLRQAGREALSRSPSVFARTRQGNKDYPGIDRFKDITLKKGTVVYAGFPGQGHFYTTAGAIRRVGDSAAVLNRGLQIRPHPVKPMRTRVAAYQVIEDTPAAFALAIANTDHGHGWLPQIVVPSYQASLKFLGDFPLGP